MSNSQELLTTVLQNIFTPCMRLRGVHLGRANYGSTTGGLVCAEVPIEHGEMGLTGVLSVSVSSDCFVTGGPQWAVLVCRIAVESGRYLDRACVFTGGDRLRNEFGELLAAFLNSAPTGPPPSLRRSTVVVG